MTKNKSDTNKITEENLEYSIMGDAYLFSSMNIDNSLDNSLQNFIISMERDKMHKKIKNKGEK